MEWKKKNKKITERKPARPRFVWFEMQWLKLRESRTHKHPENCFLKKSNCKTILTFFLADEKESNITFLFAKERCQKLIFTFFCKATKGLLFAKAILKIFIPFSFCKRKVSKPYFHFLL